MLGNRKLKLSCFSCIVMIIFLKVRGSKCWKGCWKIGVIIFVDEDVR